MICKTCGRAQECQDFGQKDKNCDLYFEESSNGLVVEYMIVSCSDPIALSKDVNAWIGKGWQPFGNMVFCNMGDCCEWMQTITREDR